MKKFKAVLAFTVLACALTACGGKKAENVETEPASTSAASEHEGKEDENADVVALPDEFEAEYFEGIVTSVKGNRLTLKNEDKTMTFDITNAEITGDSALLTGCDAEAEYAKVDGDVYPADMVTVLMDVEQQAASENRDPYIYGVLQFADINDITIIDDSGVERTFDNQMSRTVSFNELKAGDPVYVTYCGTVFDEEEERGESEFTEPIAIKVVAADAVESEDAKANYFIGTVDSSYQNGIVSVANDIATFEVTADESIMNGINEEDEVKVYYDGALAGISVEATKIEKVNG